MIKENHRSKTVYALLFVLPFLLYFKTIFFDFIPTWDDSEYVINNFVIRKITLENLYKIFTTSVVSHYAPLQIITYAFEYTFWGDNAKGYHLTNIIIHSLNACLAYSLIMQLSKDRFIALFASLIFAVHPINVESVAWVSERKNVLSAMFFFLSCRYYFYWRLNNEKKLYIFSLILGFSAILSKTVAVILPLILLTYDLFFGYISKKRFWWTSYIPFFIIGFFAAFMTFFAHVKGDGFMEGVLTANTLFGKIYPTSLVIFWNYIKMLLLPFNLSGYYDTKVYSSFLEPAVLLSLVSWLFVTYWIIKRCEPVKKFWFSWFWISLLPVSNILPINNFYADRYMYMPSLGFFVLLGFATRFFFKKLIEIKKTGFRINESFLTTGSIVATFLYFAPIAFNRMDVWKNEITFWEDTALKAPLLYKPQVNLGIAYEQAGNFEKAEQFYLKALQLWPEGEAKNYLNFLKMKWQYQNSLNKK